MYAVFSGNVVWYVLTGKNQHAQEHMNHCSDLFVTFIGSAVVYRLNITRFKPLKQDNKNKFKEMRLRVGEKDMDLDLKGFQA